MIERKNMIERSVQHTSMRNQCSLLSVSRSGLYYTPSSETGENLRIMRFMDAQYPKTPFYGERRLLSIVRMEGYQINIKRLRRLMKTVRWRTLYPQRRTSIADRGAKKYPYLLKNMKIERSNQVWAIDITYIPMKYGFMY
jgi:putative transposase